MTDATMNDPKATNPAPAAPGPANPSTANADPATPGPANRGTSADTLAPPTPEELDAARAMVARVEAVVADAYRGPARVVRALTIALIAPGHVLLEGVPGVAKTTIARALASATACSFGRVQFTPDLMPSDITGGFVLDRASDRFVFRHGPIFHQIVLGDEINRTPPRTQAALLEAMQEGQVTVEGQTFALPQPFLVLATRNPIDEEGVYPLPEAQLDRFLLSVEMGYPSERDEVAMLDRHARAGASPAAVLSAEQVVALRRLTERVTVSEVARRYIVAIARATRSRRGVWLGASPRASLALQCAARANALLAGRHYVGIDDIRAMAGPVLRHRLLLEPAALAAGDTPDRVIDQVLTEVPWDRA